MKINKNINMGWDFFLSIFISLLLLTITYKQKKNMKIIYS